MTLTGKPTAHFVWRVILFGALLAISAAVPAQEASPSSSSPRPGLVFERGVDVLFPAPLGAAGRWALLDHHGRMVQEGTLTVGGERELRLGALESGVYYFFWGLDEGRTPNRLSPSSRRLSCMVTPAPERLPEDHFFAFSYPGAPGALVEEKTGPGSDFQFLFSVAPWLGMRRLQCSFGPEHAPAVGRSGDEIVRDWGLLDRLVGMASFSKLRFVAVLEDPPGAPLSAKSTLAAGLRPALPPVEDPSIAPEAPANALDESYVRDLTRHFGFKLDEFLIQPGPNRSDRFVSIEAWAKWAKPLYQAVKARNRLACVAVGPLETLPDYSGFAHPDLVEGLLFGPGAAWFDALDHPAEGGLDRSKRLALALATTRGDAPAKEVAVHRASIRRPDDSIAGEFVQAAEMAKKIVWFRHRGYRRLAAGELIDNEPLGEGFFTRRSAGADPEPRMVAAAWVQAVERLAGSRPLGQFGFAADTHEIYAFERLGETVFVAWVPVPEGREAGGDRRIAVTLKWPDGTAAQVLDILGRDALSQRLVRRSAGKFDIILTEQPVYVVVPATGKAVGW